MINTFNSEDLKKVNLIDILKERSVLHNTGITFIEGGTKEDFLSYCELHDKALLCLGALQEKGLNPKDELVFQIEDNKSFLIIFWACILGGIIPVPLTIGNKDDHKKKLFNVCKVLNRPFVIITKDRLEKLSVFSKNNGFNSIYKQIQDSCIEIETILDSKNEGKIFDVKDTDIAFIQFSSGSTGNPKGVVLTHKNLITNINAISDAAGYSPEDSMLSWMPLTHDMGMIGFHLNPLCMGMNHYLIPTNHFVRRPKLWLDVASESNISILCSPNFGYRYLMKHCIGIDNLNWNLSSVRLLYNGAEPISEKLADEFIEFVKPYGLNKKAMCPVYGLAEASLAVTISNLKESIISLNLKRDKLAFGEKVVVAQETKNTISFVNVGKVINDCSLMITDDNNQSVGDEVIGHIQIKGDNVTSGYYNNSEVTKKTINNGWLRTGDLGFLREGSLYITGRAKDIIFINGQNFYPHDIEQVAEELDEIELNKIVLTGFFNPITSKEEVIAFVFHRGSKEKFIPIIKRLKSHINLRFGFEIDVVLNVKDIPRTTSGKLQRFKLLQKYSKGEYNELVSELNELIIKFENQNNKIVVPDNEEEKIILQAWKKILNKENIRITDKFFEIGGNSMKAAELGMILNKKFNVDVSFETLYEKQTVRELAKVIHKLDLSTYKSIPAAKNSEKYHSLSSAQKRLYYSWALDNDNIAYNIPFAIKVLGKLDKNVLSNCVNQLIKRHDSLRMSFKMFDEPKFFIEESIDFKITTSDVDTDNVEKEIQSLVKPFDLSESPLFRIHVLKVNKEHQILYLDFHHIISDGISLQMFLQELFDLYQGKDLPKSNITYTDFTYWEKDMVKKNSLESQKKYWLSELSGEIPLLEMPLDYSRPSIFNSKGTKIESNLNSFVSQKLKKIGFENKCTPHTLLFSIYYILLSKYTNQQEIIIGVPVSGRSHADLKNVQGMFVNNLPIRIKAESDISFLELLESIKYKMIAVLDNQDYPFEDMVQNTQDIRDVSRNPIFDTMFLYQDTPISKLNSEEIELSRYSFDPGFSKFDISMEIFNDQEEINYAIEYADELFSESKMSQFALHFEHLVNHLVDNPDSKLNELNILTEEEYGDQIKLFNTTDKKFPDNKTIHELFEAQALKSPESIAITYQTESFSYLTLNEKANSLAFDLKKSGIKPKDAVAVVMDKSPEFVISILAILKAGGSFVPIASDLPEERIKYILENSNSKGVLTCKEYLGIVSEIVEKSKKYNQLIVEVKADSITPMVNGPENESNPDDLVYIIYTSGTTGNPKGVMIEHRSLINYSSWASKLYIKEKNITFPLYTSISFDLTITSIFTPLITGNKIVIYQDNNEELLIEQVLNDNKSNVIKLTPSHLRLINDAKLLDENNSSIIKRIIVGGEKFDTELAENFSKKFNDQIEIYNEYGPTEATVGCMIYKYQKNDKSLTVPIGRPIANTQVYVLDRDLKPLPVGVYGELYVAGSGLARGYINNEELTKEKFIHNPFAEGQKMYKTGDIAKYIKPDLIEYSGRIDEQIKINGYRIELSEIKNQILLHEAIEEALISSYQNEKGNVILCLYYKCFDNFDESIDDITLRDFLAKKMPYYMIPAHFIQIDKIPLTKNGKVDYKALSIPEKKSKYNHEEILASSEIEKIAITVWEEILSEEKINIKDNFFELGGDSIKAVQIASKLNEKGIYLKVKDILTFQTIEQISLHSEFKSNTYEQGIISGERDLFPIDDWFFSHDFQNENYFNQSVLLSLRKKISISELEEAFKVLITTHDGLRQNFNPNGKKMFYNNEFLKHDFQLEIFDDKQIDSIDLEKICSNFKNNFDITKDLLIKAGLIVQDGMPDLLLISAHHLLIDGVSWRIILDDLYKILNKGKENVSFKKTASLLDWDNELKKYVNSQDNTLELNYWKDQLNIDFNVPQDFTTIDWRMHGADKIKDKLSIEATTYLIKEAHHAYRSDNFIILTTALALSLRDWTNSGQFIVELENHGRNLDEVDVSRTVGWFTALYPKKLEVTNLDIGTNIKMIKEQIKAIPNHGIGYGLQKYNKQLKTSSIDSLSEIRLNYLGQFGNELNNDLFSYNTTDIGPEIDPENKFTTKLELNMMIIGDQLEIEIIFNKAAHKKSTIIDFKNLFLDNLHSILNHIKAEGNTHFTPSDFEAVQLDQEDLEALFE